MKPWNRPAWVLAVVLLLALVGFSRSLRPRPFVAPSPTRVALAGAADFQATVRRLDAALAQDWQQAGVTPAPRAPDLQIARRLSLALTGTVPSVEEIRALEAIRAEDRIQWWATHLLEDRRSADYLAERWARVLVGVEDGPFIVYRRHRLVSWLADQFHANRPYDQVVRDLLTAEGIWTTRPQVNFVTVTIDPNNEEEGPDEQKLAGRVSRAFLGVRLDCVQCHDDLFGDRWKQKDFHQLAAFFAPSEMSLTGIRDQPDKRYEYRYLRQPEKEWVPPTVPFAAELVPSEGPLRGRLATWVTHADNRAFARTLVNRVWALLFSRPRHKPVDDLPLDGPFEPGLEVLAEDFVQHGHDLHRLVRLIAASRAFQADSRVVDPEGAVTSAQESRFASFPVTRLRPEQVAGALLQSARLGTLNARSHVFVRVVRYFEQQDFVKRFGDLGQDEFDAVGGTIPQRLVMMNGELMRERTKEDLVMNAATRIGVLAPDDATAVETAYLAVLTRRPTPEEARHFVARLGDESGGPRARRMGDLCWTLLNSTEFSWNH
jgi:hypothetical protein